MESLVMLFVPHQSVYEELPNLLFISEFSLLYMRELFTIISKGKKERKKKVMATRKGGEEAKSFQTLFYSTQPNYFM